MNHRDIEIFNTISDVVANRPDPRPEIDRVYMKTGDMWKQAQHISHYFQNENVIFIGDGDAMSLCLMHLSRQGFLNLGPSSIQVLDLDPEVVFSINKFSERYKYNVKATIYNVADPLPIEFQNYFDAFYTNPPYGSANHGSSVIAFSQRGIEACKSQAIGCIVLADYPRKFWSDHVLGITQNFFLKQEFVIAEMIPQMHHYHLPQEYNLTSCSLIGRRQSRHLPVNSVALNEKDKTHFYGRGTHLIKC